MIVQHITFAVNSLAHGEQEESVVGVGQAYKDVPSVLHGYTYFIFKGPAMTVPKICACLQEENPYAFDPTAFGIGPRAAAAADICVFFVCACLPRSATALFQI